MMGLRLNPRGVLLVLSMDSIYEEWLMQHSAFLSHSRIMESGPRASSSQLKDGIFLKWQVLGALVAEHGVDVASHTI